MKKVFFLIFCLLCVIFLYSCKKKNNEKLIIPVQPLPYLPVYPGSYWKYVSGNDTLLSKTSDNYIEFQGLYLTTLGPGYMPGYYIKGYYRWFDGGYQNRDWHCIFSEKVGRSWTNNISSWPFVNYDFETYEVLSKTVSVQGDTIVLQRLYTKYQSNDHGYYIYQKYKRNVGLICEFYVDTLKHDTAYSKILINYHINH